MLLNYCDYCEARGCDIVLLSTETLEPRNRQKSCLFLPSEGVVITNVNTSSSILFLSLWKRLVNVTIGHWAPPAPSLNRRWFSRAVFGFQKTKNRPQRTTGRTAKSGSSLKSGDLRGIGRINIFHYAVSRAVKGCWKITKNVKGYTSCDNL